MTNFKLVPYVSGAKELFAALVNDARTSNKRIALFGDSQEDTTGESTCVDLSFYSWQKLGQCHETCIMPPFNHGSASGSSLFWLSAGAGTSSTTGIVPASYVPPGQIVMGSGTYSSGCIRSLFAFKGDTNAIAAAGAYSIADPTAGCVADIFLYTNSAGPAEIKWNSAPVAGGPGSGSLFAPINASAVTSGLALNASDNLPVRFRTSTLPYDANKPYAQLIYGGHDGSAYVAGTQMAGARLISLAGAGGLVWEPFSVGGYTTESVLANHANAGPMFQAMGGPDGWSAIAIGMMNNNPYSLGDTPAQYKTKLSALITLLRTWAGSTLPVLLLGDPPTTGVGWPAGYWDNFNACAAVQAELAAELVDVMAVNTQRLMFDGGYDPSQSIYSADGLHPTPLGAGIRGAAIVNAVFGAYVPSTSPTVAEIVSAINADPTQITQQTNAATAATAAADTVAAIKADPDLGTADGGLVANAAASKAKTDLIGTVRSLIRW